MPGSDSPYRQQGVEIITREAVRHLSHNLWPPFHGLDKENWRNCLYHPIPLQSNKARGRYSLLHQRFIQLFEQYAYATAADCPNDVRELILFEVIAETGQQESRGQKHHREKHDAYCEQLFQYSTMHYSSPSS